jgi:hypothetical protein
MNDFTFTNRAYDLLLNLKEEGVIKSQLPRVESIQDLRLMIDVIKDVYPLYANADTKTIIGFIQDTFNVDPAPLEINRASHEQEQWRKVRIEEILPGVTLKIQEENYYYLHTFWTYTDTHKRISIKDNYSYSKAFMTIWEKAKQGKVFIRHTFKYHIGDKIYYNNIPGTIKSRIWLDEKEYGIKNYYGISWDKEQPLTYYWFKESELLIQKKLEAMPMRTIEIINRRKGKAHVKTWESWTQKQYDADKLEYEYASDEEAGKSHAGWIKYIITYTGTKRKPASEKRKIQLNKSTRQTRIVKKQLPTDKLVCIKHFPTGVVSRILKSQAELLVKKTDSDYGFVNKHEFRKYRTIVSTNKKANGLTLPKPEKKVANYTKIGGTEGIGNAKIVEGVVRSGRRYRKSNKGSRLVQEQWVTEIVPEVKEEIRITDSTWEKPWANQVMKVVRPAYVKLKRILTRIPAFKEFKITEDIKLQLKERSINDKLKYAVKTGKKSTPELIDQFKTEERRNDKFSSVEKWSHIFEELVILITQHKYFEHGKFEANIHPKSILSMVQRKINIDGACKWTDDKIKDFVRYIRQTTHGVFTTEKIKTERPTGARKIITNKNGVIIGGGKPYKKPARIKKPGQNVEFETLKTVTKIDYSKLKLNYPDEGKTVYVKCTSPEGEVEKVGVFKENTIQTITGELLCEMRDVIQWKYLKEDEYKDFIIDEGGGRTEVGIKFRRKDPEHIKEFFKSKYKIKKQKIQQHKAGLKKLQNETKRKNTNIS